MLDYDKLHIRHAPCTDIIIISSKRREYHLSIGVFFLLFFLSTVRAIKHSRCTGLREGRKIPS